MTPNHVFYAFQGSLIIFQNFGFSLIFDPLDLAIFWGRSNRGLRATLRTRCAVSFTARLLILGHLVVHMTLNSCCEKFGCLHINGGAVGVQIWYFRKKNFLSKNGPSDTLRHIYA